MIYFLVISLYDVLIVYFYVINSYISINEFIYFVLWIGKGEIYVVDFSENGEFWFNILFNLFFDL